MVTVEIRNRKFTKCVVYKLALYFPKERVLLTIYSFVINEMRMCFSSEASLLHLYIFQNRQK